MKGAARWSDAAETLEHFAAGETGGVDVLAVNGPPLLVVDADSGTPGGLTVPAAFPAVVVAVSRSARPRSGGADVVLCGVEQEGRGPAVAVSDLDEAVAAIGTAVAAAPRAAVALVQLLRVSEGRPVPDGLVLESLVYSMLQAGPEFAAWVDRRPAPVPPADARPPLTVDRDGDRLLVTLDRPHRHNAYDRAMRDALCDALAVAAADPRLRVELSGRGPSFCSGGDLDEFGTAPDPPSAHLVRTARSPARALASMAERVTATLHGACVGSGIELPAFAGVVRARPGTRIRLPELAMGLVPGAGGTVSLPRRIGRCRTAWMAITGEWVDAGRAARWGLVDALVDDA